LAILKFIKWNGNISILSLVYGICTDDWFSWNYLWDVGNCSRQSVQQEILHRLQLQAVFIQKMVTSASGLIIGLLAYLAYNF
jgi:hypothetical protein